MSNEGFKSHKGFYKCKNPEKYKGNPNQIVFRSRWELKLMDRLDRDPNIVEWGSETVIVPYTDKGSGKLRRYFVDFYVKKADGSVLLIEVKPASQSRPPTPEGKSKRRFINECMTWATNSSKWEACKRYCAARGWEFRVFTEKELGITY